MQKVRRVVGRIVLGLIVGMMATSCDGGGGNDGNGGEDNTSTTSAFNGTFTGNIKTTQNGQDSVRPMIMNLSAMSPLNGTFIASNGSAGSISGNVERDTAIFTATVKGDCSGSFSGSMTLIDNDTLSLDAQGSDCNGSLSTNGEIVRLSDNATCIDISGTFRATETVTATCTAEGESETDTLSGEGTVVVKQSGCIVSYVVPNFNITRDGKIEGHHVDFTGPFIIPLVGRVNVTQNIATIEGTIVDENEIALNGSGIATGTVDGIGFSCTGVSTGELLRQAKCDFSSEPGEPERCFGGIGTRCKGDAPGDSFTKNENTCFVDGWMSVGSILHDKCCLATQNAGFSCANLNQGDKNLCKTEWEEAWFNSQCSILGFPRQWESTFGPYPFGNTGDNTNKDLRAPKGTRVNPSYQKLCQAGSCQVDAQKNTIIRFDECGNYCLCE